MWDLIYWLLAIVIVLVAIAAGIYVTYVGMDIVRRLLDYLNDKKEIRITSEQVHDLGVHVKMHKPEHLKAMEKKFGIQLNFRKKDNPENGNGEAREAEKH